MVHDSGTIKRFQLYTNNCQKYVYTGGVCTLLNNNSTAPDLMFAPVYTDRNKRPALDDVKYIPYMSFDLDIYRSDYNQVLLQMSPHDRTRLYSEFVIDAMSNIDMEPTVVIGTGGGVHIYYELYRESANSISEINKLYSTVGSKEELLSLGLDVASCHAVSSVRVPDRLTTKYNGYTTSILHADDNTYDIEKLVSAVGNLNDIKKPEDVSIGRNVYLYRLGISLLYEGYTHEEVEVKLTDEYHLVKSAGTHPFTLSELRGILNSLSKSKLKPRYDSDVIKGKILHLANSVTTVVKKRTHQDVYHAILTRYALVTGNCFPISQKELARYTGIPQQTISRIVRHFVKSGLLEVVNPEYKIGHYCKTYQVPNFERILRSQN